MGLLISKLAHYNQAQKKQNKTKNGTPKVPSSQLSTLNSFSHSLLKFTARRTPTSYQMETTQTTEGGGGGATGIAAQMEVEAFRRLFPLPFYKRHLLESVRPDARALDYARDTTISLGPVASADGSALVKIGETAMLAAIKLEVMTPSKERPDEGSIVVEFYMPPICSPMVRPGRPAEVAPVISKQLLDVIRSSGMVNLKELCLISGKASWIAYLDIYCLNADGSLFDAALLSAVAAFTHLQIPLVSVTEEGRVFTVSSEQEEKTKFELVNKEKRKLSLSSIPFPLTCVIHEDYILVDPTAEEETVMETSITLVLDTLGNLVSIYKPGGVGLASTEIMKECITRTKRRMQELKTILEESVSVMEVD
ncbi:Exosome complex component Rrp42 [Rhynchospora pubera]|uniref:Ribosomal RNA-processing protein 43 n=1 Tax=Rhynchospora pubera TaxID=906938 RepID=A0AAV8FVI6_9POAL|nr:Exosome complex component Rrp42 [Rhynchospora pubera]